MKFKNYIYAMCMVVLLVLSFISIDRGFNVKTKQYVHYDEDNNIKYKVHLKDNDIYDNSVLDMDQKYISELVNDIDISFNYNSVFTDVITGYYSYKTVANLMIYEGSKKEIISKEEYTIKDSMVEVLNSNNKSINVLDTVVINYSSFRDKALKLIDKYGVDASGFLEVKFIVNENLLFDKINQNVEEGKELKVLLPLTYNTFRVSVTDNNDADSYFDFANLSAVNYLLLILGSFFLALAIAFLALIIRDIISTYQKRGAYKRELVKIFNEYDDIIVKVTRFYNKKKYNLIYVDSFKELMDVYNQVGNPISYREIKKNTESIFLIIDEDNAWIYRMLSK